MDFALTTRWNASRHAHGEDMIHEILNLGFDHVELGYDLRLDLVPGVEKMVQEGAVKVDSVHNYCPTPISALRGHPEVFTLASADARIRENAVQHTTNTIRFAAKVGATKVIVHAGNVSMKRMTPLLLELHEQGQQFSARYEKTKLKLQMKREKKVRKHLDFLRSGLESLLPVLEEAGVCLAIENLPTWEAIPTEIELQEMLGHFGSKHLGYWHDIGHAQIRENLGFINQARWLERLEPHLAGFHIHDVRFPGQDHLMPPLGDIDFAHFRRFATLSLPRVIEPTPATAAEDIKGALAFLRESWAPGESDNVENE